MVKRALELDSNFLKDNIFLHLQQEKGLPIGKEAFLFFFTFLFENTQTIFLIKFIFIIILSF